MNLSSVNYWSALAAAIVSYVISFFWYSPILFGDIWLAYRDLGAGPSIGVYLPIPFALDIALFFVVAVITACFANALGYRGLGGAFVLSLWLGGGILATSMVAGYLFLALPWQVGAIDLALVYLRMFVFCLFACLWVKKDTAKH